MKETKIQTIKLSDLTPDGKNFNRGTARGKRLIRRSLDKFGAGRSILTDKDGNIIAGNKTVENAIEAGFEDVVVVHTDGKTLVAVQRDDVVLDSAVGREMALADNATAKANLDWDEDTIREQADAWDYDASEWDDEDGITPDEYGTEFSLPDGGKSPFVQMTLTLSDEQSAYIKDCIADIMRTDEYKYMDTMGNTNSHGNAIYLIVKQWADARK